MKRYPEYRDSGVEWLDKVPAHWQVVVLRRLLLRNNGIKIGPFGSQLKLEYMVEDGFKVYGQANVIASDFNRGRKFVSKEKYIELSSCGIQPDDIVLTMMGTAGRCGLVPKSALPGIMDSHLLRVRVNTDYITPAFAVLILDKAPYIKEQTNIAGKGAIMHGLNSGIVKNLVFAFPPIGEQNIIIQFLETLDRRVNRLLRKKRRLIELLNEQKQAIIQRAVTKGLNPDAPMKPSGVHWLGKIPAHWEVRRNAALFFERVERGDPEWPILIVSLRTGVTIGEEETAEGRPRRLIEDRSTYRKAASGDIAYNTMRMWQGALGVVPVDGLVSPAYVVAAPSRETNSQFFAFLFRTDIYKSEVNRVSTGIASDRNRLYWDQFKNLPSPVPPLAEQDSIVDTLELELSKINRAIDRIESEIDLIREYRIRLISDVVTGKLDVRNAKLSKAFPDREDSSETLFDETDELEETEADVEDMNEGSDRENTNYEYE